VFRRAGQVLADRCHVHVLRTPREVRNAIAYVLLNARRHLAKAGRALVSNEAIGCVLEKAMVDRLFGERDFMRRSTCNPTGDRKTSAVCDCHDLGPLPPLGLPDAEPPFLAPAKEPSMKTSRRPMPPRW
jgi:hypothetical protein